MCCVYLCLKVSSVNSSKSQNPKPLTALAEPWSYFDIPSVDISDDDDDNEEQLHGISIDGEDLCDYSSEDTDNYYNITKPPSLNGWLLRESCPDLIPVSMHRDPKSRLPDIDTNKYHVPGDMSLEDFVEFIKDELRDEVPVDVYFKKTNPPTEALMSAIDEENRDLDGFLHVTYSERFPGMLKRNKGIHKLSKPILLLDFWNLDAGVVGIVEVSRGRSSSIDPWKLRETCPDHIPVSVEKDASSDVPDIAVKKYHVPGVMALREFVDFLQRSIWWTGNPENQRMLVYFKKTVPVTGALMSAVDEENRDEDDGFLHITYSGEERRGIYASCEEL